MYICIYSRDSCCIDACFQIITFVYAQVELWKRYINWEKCNPLKTEEETLITRRGTGLFLKPFNY